MLNVPSSQTSQIRQKFGQTFPASPPLRIHRNLVKCRSPFRLKKFLSRIKLKSRSKKGKKKSCVRIGNPKRIGHAPEVKKLGPRERFHDKMRKPTKPTKIYKPNTHTPKPLLCRSFMARCVSFKSCGSMETGSRHTDRSVHDNPDNFSFMNNVVSYLRCNETAIKCSEEWVSPLPLLSLFSV